MTTDLLAKARAYEAKYGSRITDAERPVYHVTPTIMSLRQWDGSMIPTAFPILTENITCFISTTRTR